MTLSIAYLYIFLQSCALELPVYLYFLKNQKRDVIFSIIAINAITHPIFFFLIMGLQTSFLLNILFGEALVTLAEAYLVHRKFKVSYKEALYLSFHANLISWQVGPIASYAFSSILN